MDREFTMAEPAMDAVITWVNGNDCAYKEKLQLALAGYGNKASIAAVSPTRFNQCGEINYCLLSILRYAPWLRKIFIVTDNQVPDILTKLASTARKKIIIVDHHDLFADYNEFLPTFNSLAIETLLWRIKGLAKNFVYFNDDCILIRPVSPKDFFRKHKLVLRGKWKMQDAKKFNYQNILKKIANVFLVNKLAVSEGDEHWLTQINTAKLMGWKNFFFHLAHVPFPLRQNTLELFFTKYPALLRANIRFAFRNLAQFWPVLLAENLEIKQKNVIFDSSLQAIMVHGSFHPYNKIQARLKKAEKNKKVAFFCVQSLDQAPKATHDLIINWLNNRIILDP